MRHRTIQIRLLAAIIGASAGFLATLGVFAVGEITDLTRVRVHTAVLDLVALKAGQIEGFFSEHGRVVRTVLANPALLDWFADYDEARRRLEGDEGFTQIQAFFAAVVNANPEITSVFLATDSTAEYFREIGRVEREGYDPKTRWWWVEAVERDRLYVTPPGVDAGTGNISVAVQTTVYLDDGRFLGVGGIDVLLGTLGEHVRQIKYQGAGDAFLVDGQGRIIYFPELDLELEGFGPLATALSQVESLCPESDGFVELAGDIQASDRGLRRLRWRGEDLIAVFAPVRAIEPELEWTLGLMIPEELITASIVRARVHTVLAILIALMSIGGLALAITNRTVAALTVQDRRRAELLTEVNRKLVEADRLKSRFLATMSHELRTPLNSIIGFSEILRTRLAGRLDARFLKFLNNIHDSGEHLLSMISDILDLSKIEAGRLELQRETISVEKTLGSVGSIVRGVARERRISLHIETAERLPPVEADPVRLKQILFNLLSNAVKFSSDGSVVTISARELTEAESPLGVGSVELSVADSGIGISPEDHGVIFEEFRQVEGPDGLKHAGTGLGLALVKRLVELHHGEVSVDSVPGQGSTFRVVLPVTWNTCEEAEIAAEPLTRPTASGRLVLVVEDDAAAFERMRKHLATRGYETVRSADGADAVDLARRLAPAAIVLDIVLPAADGWDVLRELKGMPATCCIPVIIVSVLDSHELGFALGADAYFTKPFNDEDLVTCLSQLVPRSGSARPRVLVIDDDPQLHELLEEALGEAGYDLEHSLSGKDGMRRVRGAPPDLIILDLMMEEMDGFDVARALRDDPVARAVPIVVYSARRPTREERQRLRGKIQALVQKDADSLETLTAVIGDLLQRRTA